MIKKSFLILFLVFAMLFSVACGEEQNKSESVDKNDKTVNITISDLESLYIDSDKKSSFTLEEKNDGYSFKYSVDTTFKDVTYTGTADKDKKVKTLKIVYNDVKTSYLESESELTRVLSLLLSGSDQITGNEYMACLPAYDYLAVWNLANNSEDTKMDSVMDIFDIFYNKTKTRTVNGWKFTADTDSAKKMVTINMSRG